MDLSGAPALPVVVQPHRREHHSFKGQTVFLQLTDHLGGRFLAAFVLKAGELSRGHAPRTAVLYIPSTAMYNAAMHTRVSSLALRDA
jgi:hypothetical protein